MADEELLTRWRLLLGRFADDNLHQPLAGREFAQRRDRALDYLYGREYSQRGVRSKDRTGGGDGGHPLNVPDWLHEVRDLFPRETVELLERHALEKYGLTELVTDADTLASLEPSYDLLRLVLTFRHVMKGPVVEVAKKLVRQIIEELRQRLATEIKQVLWGRLNRQRRTRHKQARNLDWLRTIRANLRYYDPERRRIVPREMHFLARVNRQLPWHIIMAVDCSGSMLDSVIYSAVMAGIFRGLPAVRCSLLAFDTAVVDLSEQADDPTELLMSVQLGGGTDIAGALGACERLVVTPTRTILLVVTDFYEGGPPARLPARIAKFREAGVRVLGLAALDATAMPSYDKQMAERCAAAGAEIAALTPRRLAEWLGRVLT